MVVTLPRRRMASGLPSAGVNRQVITALVHLNYNHEESLTLSI